jgi:hypothetical protein
VRLSLLLLEPLCQPSFAKFVPKCFNIFDAFINEVIFLILFFVLFIAIV